MQKLRLNIRMNAADSKNFLDWYHKPSNSSSPSVSRKKLKRCGSRLKIFPYKIRVTDDKVTKDFCNLQITSNANQRKQRTIAEIENSLVLDTDSEEEKQTEESIKIEINEEYRKEIESFKANLLQECKQLKPSTSNALVLWTPPKLLAVPNDTECTHAHNVNNDHTGVRPDLCVNNTINTVNEMNVMSSELPSVSKYYPLKLNNFSLNEDEDMMEL